jgi:stage II sporulation protein D
MGLAGRSYEEILAFYFPNATLSLAARGIPWRKTTSERLDVWSVDASDARRVMGLARSALAGVEGRVGRRAGRIVLWVYPDIDTWRDASGASGRIAAFTRGGRIDLQPVAVLDRRAALELTVRHEIAHAVIESVARQGTPALLREGLAIHLSGGAIGDGEEAAFHRRAQQEIRARIAARGERAVIEELWRPFRQPSL